jgi:hypothetical protein
MLVPDVLPKGAFHKRQRPRLHSLIGLRYVRKGGKLRHHHGARQHPEALYNAVFGFVIEKNRLIRPRTWKIRPAVEFAPDNPFDKRVGRNDHHNAKLGFIDDIPVIFNRLPQMRLYVVCHRVPDF